MYNGGFVRASLAVSVSAALVASAIVVAKQTETRQETRQETSQKGGVSSASASGRATATGAARGGISQVSRAGGGSGGFGTRVDPNKRLYAVWMVKSPSVAADAAGRGDVDHMKYMKYLMQDRTLVSEGPFEDGTGYLLVIQTESDARAKSIVEGDPAVQSGFLKADLKGWKWRFGGLSDGMAAPPPVPVRRAGGG